MDKTDKSTTPLKTVVQKDNIPNEIKDLKHWGLWGWVFKKGLWTKVPKNKIGEPIDAKLYNLSFKKALKHYKKSDKFDGIGFYFSPDHDVLGIDFDDCYKDGKIIDKKVKKLIKKLGSYYEESPSGSGLHVMGFGASKLNGVDRKYIYAGTRYFTFTGNGAKGTLKDIGEQVNKLFKVEKKIDQATTGKNESPISVGELYSIVMNIRPDLSEPDWYLVCKAIHYKTNGSDIGLKLFLDWSAGVFCKKSQRYKDFNESDCIGKWNRCKKVDNPVGLPTLREVESNYPVKVTKKVSAKHLFKKQLELKNYNSKKLTLKHLPKNVRPAAKETARFNKVDADLVITTMFMITSAAINKKVNIIEKVGLEHHCSMGCLIAMPSGGRKSAIDRPLMKPFIEFEQTKMNEWEKNKVTNEQIVKTLKKKMKLLEASYASDELDVDEHGVPIVDEVQIEIMTALQKKINQYSVPRPKLIESDATEERLSDSLDKNNETLFIQSDDARNTIKNIVGRYDNNGSENIYITGLTGDTYRRSRVKDDIEIVLNRPCINMSLKVQLDLAKEMVAKGAVRESGLMARIFMKVAESDVPEQYREEEKEKDLDYSKLYGYYNAIQTILEYEGPTITVGLSDKAIEARRLFANEYATMIEDGGEWKDYKDISNKIVTLSVKMACVQSLLRSPSQLATAKDGFGIKGFFISESDYCLGRDVVKVLMNQSLEVTRNLEENAIISGAIKLLVKLEADLKLWEESDAEKDYWTITDMGYKFNDREAVARWANCLLENGMLIQDGNKYYPNF